MGGWTANVYTQEQQTRLGVDADGKNHVHTETRKATLEMGRRTGGQQSLDQPGPKIKWSTTREKAPGGWTATNFMPGTTIPLRYNGKWSKKG